MPSRLRRHDAPGQAHFWTISCFNRLSFFWMDSIKQVAIDALNRLRNKHGICVMTYVVMPEHVHVILYPHVRLSETIIPVSILLRDLKQFVGFHAKARLRDYWRQHGCLWSDPLNAWAQGELGSQEFWTTRGYDFNLHDEETLREKVQYCHNNPVKRGLVDAATDWKWSSCRFFELNDDSILRMDWNGAFPIEW